MREPTRPSPPGTICGLTAALLFLAGIATILALMAGLKH